MAHQALPAETPKGSPNWALPNGRSPLVARFIANYIRPIEKVK